MVFALGAAGSALDALQSLSLLKSSSRTKAAPPSPGAANPFEVGGGTQAQGSSPTGTSGHSRGRASISPQTMGALIDAQAQMSSTNSPPKNPSDGTNLKAADRVFGKLDTDGDGSVSIKELAAELLKPDGQDDHRHTDTVSSKLTTDAASDAPTSDGSKDSSDSGPTDANSADPNSSTSPIRHPALTVVPIPATNLVPLDVTAIQAFHSVSVETKF